MFTLGHRNNMSVCTAELCTQVNKMRKVKNTWNVHHFARRLIARDALNWAHLTPALVLVAGSYPHAQSIHFMSDGPTMQYKNKNNIYVFSQFSLNYSLVP